MLRTLELENFRSIVKDTVHFGPLTVLVGANGSGKSNLIKALGFLGLVSRDGVMAAAGRLGGFAAIVPKAVPAHKVNSQRVRVSSTWDMGQPENYPDDAPGVTVDHELVLGHSKTDVAELAEERMVFHEVVNVARALEAVYRDEDDPETTLSGPSTITLFQSSDSNDIKIEHDPMSRDLYTDYLNWWGYIFLEDRIKTEDDFNQLLANMTKVLLLARGDSAPHSFLETEYYAFRFANQANVFARQVKAIVRYDLLLSSLRKAQSVSGPSSRLSQTGDNMASSLRAVLADRETKDRILETLAVIAPHVDNMDPQWLLTTGSQYVAFRETMSRRRVESWEASDGTLRALAILLALETQQDNSIVMIEEPEQNLHPWAVRALMDHIRDCIRRKALQVIVSTHSEQVLSRLYPDELLVASRTANAGTRFHRIQDILPGSDLQMGEVGRMWADGLLQGVPDGV